MNCTGLSIPFLLFFIPVQLFTQTPQACDLEIEIKGISFTEGQIAMGMNNSKEGWPKKPQFEYRWKKEGMKDGILVVKIDRIPYGTYAISVLDDTNSNEKMDMFLGIPRESWGFSMNPPHKLSEPKFEECAFQLNQPVKRIFIELKHIGKNE
jgi:uncharacterized protein (DUF2141 family)